MLLQTVLFHSHAWVFYTYTTASYSPVKGHVGCFHVLLAMINRAAMRIGLPVSFQIIIFSRYISKSWIPGPYGNSIFNFLFVCLFLTRISNESILKESNPKYSLKGLMMKLKLKYFGYLMWRADSLEKTLILGKIDVRRRCLDGIVDSMEISLRKLEIVKDRKAWHSAVYFCTWC